MADLEIEYRGYAIRFAENEEVWRCWALDIDGEKLATVKRKIDKVIAAARKLPEATTCMHIDYHDDIASVRIMSLAEPRRTSRNRSDEVIEPTEAWCMTPHKERYFDQTKGEYAWRETETRKKLPLNMLYLDTPANRAAVAEMQRMRAEKQQISERIKTAKSGLATVAAHFKLKIEDAAEED